jgi:hypothetical protein
MTIILLRIGRAGAAANSARPREGGDPESKRDSSALILRSPRSGRLEGEGGLNPSRRALWALLRMRPNTCNVDARDKRGHDASSVMVSLSLNPSYACCCEDTERAACSVHLSQRERERAGLAAAPKTFASCPGCSAAFPAAPSGIRGFRCGEGEK